MSIHAGRGRGVTNFSVNTLAAARRNALKAKAAWLAKRTVPKHCHPLVTQFFELLHAEGVPYGDVADRSGISTAAFRAWKFKRAPLIHNLDAALNALGYELRIVKRQEEE